MQQLSDVAHQAPRVQFVARMMLSPYSTGKMAVSSQGQTAQCQNYNKTSPESPHQAQLKQMTQALAEHQQMQTSQSGQVQQSPHGKYSRVYRSPYSKRGVQNELPPTLNPWGQAPPLHYNLAYASQSSAGLASQSMNTQPYGNQIVQAQSIIENQQPALRQSHTQPPQPKTFYASQPSKSTRGRYHPAIAAPKVEPRKPAEQKFSAKMDSRELLQTTPLPYQPATTITSQPDFLPTHIDKDGNIITLKGNRQILNKGGGFGIAGAADKCIVCKVEFGLENPHGSHGENVKVPEGTYQWIDINNQGATEIAVRLPCGHVAGSNCILPYYLCPRCQCRLTFYECGHRVPVRPTDPTTMSAKANLPTKCTQCRVFDLEQNARLPALLAESAELKTRLDALSGAGQEGPPWETRNVEIALASVRDKIETIETETNSLIQAAQFYGYF